MRRQLRFGDDDRSAVRNAGCAEDRHDQPDRAGVTHRFTNMSAYTDEISQARLWAGFHYRFSTVVGQDMGRKLGRYVVENVMQPVAVAEAR